MSEKLREHPLIVYMAFVLPVLLLISAVLLRASVLVFLVILAWMGTSIMVLLLPISSESESS